MGRRKSKFKLRKPKIGKETTVASSSAAPPPPWIELPADITANILKRLGAVEILENLQRVCTTWRKVCHDPSMWRVIELDNPHPGSQREYELMCRQAVDRSQGQLVDLSLNYFGDDKLLNYVADRSSELKCLTLQNCINISGEGLVEAVKKLAHLEELHLVIMPAIQDEDIENIGISCPALKAFTYNQNGYWDPDVTHEFDDPYSSEYALAIASSMPNLCHLGLIANPVDNDGVEAILDGCPNLESLDLRQCYCLDLRGTLRERCQRIKHLKLPSDSVSYTEYLGAPKNEDDGSCSDYEYFDEDAWYDGYRSWSDSDYFGDYADYGDD